MFQEFPYTDMHQLNLDWIIKIAKDFLDQYTQIQTIIENGETNLNNIVTEGLENLTAKGVELTAALDAWYTEHSEDISAELADAIQTLTTTMNNDIANINSEAQRIAEQTIASIPADYTDLANEVQKIALFTYSILATYNYLNEGNIIEGIYIRNQDGREGESASHKASDYIDIDGFDSVNLINCYCCFYDSGKVFISCPDVPTYPSDETYVIPSNAKYIRISTNISQDPALYTIKNDSVTTLFNMNNSRFADAIIPLSALDDNGSIDNLVSIITTKNILDSYVSTIGTFLRPQDGATRGGYPNFKAFTDYIDITDSVLIKISAAYMCYYDENYTFIATVNNDEPFDTAEFTPPINAKYIRIGTLATYTPSVNIKKIVNLAPSTVMIDGVFLRTQDGATRNIEGFRTSDFINISGVRNITFNTCYAVIYTADKTYITSIGVTDASILTEAIPDNAYYIRFGHQNNLGKWSAYDPTSEQWNSEFNPTNMEFKDDCIPASAVKGLDHQIIPTNISTFGVDSGCDYDSISEAVSSSDGTNTILVTQGNYNQHFQIADDTHGMKRTTKTIVGLERHMCIFTRYGSAYGDDVMHTGRESYIKGLTFYARKNPGADSCGYAIHADNGWSGEGDPIVFEDCIFISEGRASVGIGTRPNSNFIFRNCVFITENAGSGAVFFHNDPNDAGNNQRLTFINCEFYSTQGCAIYVQMVGGDSNTMELTMCNCMIHSDNLGASDIITVDKSLYTGQSSNVHITNKTYGNNINIADYIR